MNPTLFEIGVAIVMLTVTIALVVWFSRHLAAASGRRMTNMLVRAGVDPDLARRGDTEAIMRDVQSRCGRCMSEALCDRWLAGKADGANDFCPNAGIFRGLTGTAGRTAP